VWLQTAYFNADPSKTRHGSDLLCSHTQCRSSGVKFLFCKHCQSPIKRENFSKHCREEHDEVDGMNDEASLNFKKSSQDRLLQEHVPSRVSINTGARKKTFTEEEEEQKDSTARLAPSFPVASPSLSDLASGSEAKTTSPQRVSQVPEFSVETKKDDPPSSSPAPNPDQPASENSDELGGCNLRQEWDLLLTQRPRDGIYGVTRPTSDWLSQVLSVSNRFTFGTDDPESIDRQLISVGSGNSGSATGEATEGDLSQQASGQI